MKSKPDLSRLIVLPNLTPSEAVVFHGILKYAADTIARRYAAGDLGRDDQIRRDVIDCCAVANELLESIRRQLETLAWPPESVRTFDFDGRGAGGKAPHPI